MKNIAKRIDREMGVIITLLLIILLLWFTNFQLESNLYTNSINIDQTEQSIDTYRHKNNALKNTLLEDESYTKIYQEAKKQGYVSAPLLSLP